MGFNSGFKGLMIRRWREHRYTTPNCLPMCHTDCVIASRFVPQIKASLYHTERNGNGTKLKETNWISGCWHVLEWALLNEIERNVWFVASCMMIGNSKITTEYYLTKTVC